MSAEGTQTAFDVAEFETTVTDADEERLVETIADSIGRLREQIDDDTLDEVFRAEPGQYTLRSDFTRDRLDPEPVTQNRVIEPLLDALGYEEYGSEAGDFSAERGEQADYAVSLRDVPSVDSSRLLIEAEPINKQLENRGHGLDQVESWLSQREFESDFGFATDGLRWIFVRYDPDSYTHSIIEEVDLRPVFLALFENATTGGGESGHTPQTHSPTSTATSFRRCCARSSTATSSRSSTTRGRSSSKNRKRSPTSSIRTTSRSCSGSTRRAMTGARGA